MPGKYKKKGGRIGNDAPSLFLTAPGVCRRSIVLFAETGLILYITYFICPGITVSVIL